MTLSFITLIGFFLAILIVVTLLAKHETCQASARKSKRVKVITLPIIIVIDALARAQKCESVQ
jgi:hypothetical protein